MTSPKLAVCLGVQRKKKVSGVCQVSLYALSLFIYLSHGCPTRSRFRSKLVSTASRAVSMSLLEEGGEGRSSGGEESGGRRRLSHQQCLRCSLSEASCCPGLLRPYPPFTSGRWLQSEGKQIRRVGVCVVAEEKVGSAGGLLCSAVRVKAPLLRPLLFRTPWEETESIVRKN